MNLTCALGSFQGSFVFFCKQMLHTKIKNIYQNGFNKKKRDSNLRNFQHFQLIFSLKSWSILFPPFLRYCFKKVNNSAAICKMYYSLYRLVQYIDILQ